MPQDPAYEDLEKDITEKHGGGRAWQEMAKSDYEGRFRTPRSLSKRQIRQKEEKTEGTVRAKRTQVTKEREG